VANRQTQEFAPETEHIHRFLQHLGVEADVQLDSRDQPMLIMSNESFEQNRRAVLTWFVLVSQRDGYSYLSERQRGTGQTML
jgi:hypothetical protein